MLYAAKSHVGLVRQMNEDGYSVDTSLGTRRLLVVADGMGGSSAGEVASRIALDEVSAFMREVSLDEATDTGQILLDAIERANREIWQTALDTIAYAGMGTTLVAALCDDATVQFANIGDSRGYIYQANELRQATKDHSLVAELVRRGQLTSEEAFHHPQRNVVTRWLGTMETSRPDLETVEWSEGDVLLLCSDGLSNLIGPEELRHFLVEAAQAWTTPRVESIADELIGLALERGGPDNITLVLAVHRKGEEAGC